MVQFNIALRMQFLIASASFLACEVANKCKEERVGGSFASTSRMALGFAGRVRLRQSHSPATGSKVTALQGGNHKHGTAKI